MLRQAIESQNKLLKDGQVLLKGGKIKEGPTVVALKKGCASATQMANQLLTVIDFGIMPDGRDVCKTELEKFLKSVAMATAAEFNALIETTKGKTRSQSNCGMGACCSEARVSWARASQVLLQRAVPQIVKL